MKILIIPILAMVLIGCNERENASSDDISRRTGDIAASAERERWVRAEIDLAQTSVENARDRVASARNANELALAEDDLREARRELNKKEDRLEMLMDRTPKEPPTDQKP